jgi:hypothetical protein
LDYQRINLALFFGCDNLDKRKERHNMNEPFDSVGISESDSDKLFDFIVNHGDCRTKNISQNMLPTYVQTSVEVSPGEKLYSFLKQKDWICDRTVVLTCQRDGHTDEFRIAKRSWGHQVYIAHITVV